MESVVEICKAALKRLTTIGYEKESFVSTGQLIFPSKRDGRRISEQELRQLFIEEFKLKHTDLYYSIETPTVYSYSFTNELKEIKVGDVSNKGQSALIDLCILEKESGTSNYSRLLNVEFKHKNATEANISKDILKLMHEKENGAFVLLLKNTDGGTLKSVFEKFSNSFKTHLQNNSWSKNDSFIEIIILSLEDGKKNGIPFIMYRNINQTSLPILDNNINKWMKEELNFGVFKRVKQIKV
jgi:hypothetical protein